MSTKISEIYDSVVSSLNTLYSTKTRIPNPYSLPDNPEQLLKDGYGLKFGGSNLESYELCRRKEVASFSVVLTREFFKLDSDVDSFDDPTKSILEDAESFKSLFYATNNIGEEEIIDINIESTSGLENVQGDKYNFISIEVTFTIKYFEVI